MKRMNVGFLNERMGNEDVLFSRGDLVVCLQLILYASHRKMLGFKIVAIVE